MAAKQRSLNRGDPPTNLQVLKATRRKPEAGDIFRMQLPDGSNLFGRVILADLPQDKAPMPSAYLTYIYDNRSTDKTPDLAQLVPQRLLIPPVFTNRMPWTKGYFETLIQRPFTKADILDHHCFRLSGDSYVDESGRPRRWRAEPCGEWGLASYRWIDDRISDALGIPTAPA